MSDNIENTSLGPVILALAHELRRLCLTGWVALSFLALFFGLSWGWTATVQWWVQAALIWWWACRQCGKLLELNHCGGNAGLYPVLGWGNRLTLLRGWLIAAVGGFLLQPWPPGLIAWLPAVLYTCAAIIDRVDGFVARLEGQTSQLGAELDTAFDALGLAVAPLLAVFYGQVHWSYLMLSCAFYLFQWGLYLRRRQGLAVYTLPRNFSRRAWAGFQMGFISVALYPVLPAAMTRTAGIAFMLPVLAGFAVDWNIANGRIALQSQPVAKVFSGLQRLGNKVLQPLLRMIVVITLLLVARQSQFSFMTGHESTWQALFVPWVFLLAGAGIALGIIGRVLALTLIGVLAWHYAGSPVGGTDVVLIFSVVWLLLFGTGSFSLWQWDDDWVNRYDGA